jgi:hypothetical protein
MPTGCSGGIMALTIITDGNLAVLLGRQPGMLLKAVALAPLLPVETQLSEPDTQIVDGGLFNQAI